MTTEMLINQIERANAAYSKGSPILTDTEYDNLWRQLKSKDPDNDLLYHTGRLINDGSYPTIVHTRPMLSLDKVMDRDDTERFFYKFHDKTLIIQPKYDGVSACIYPGPVRPRLALAGDGYVGADISHRLDEVCIHSSESFDTPQYGEIVIKLCDWNPSFGANPRNTVAGWMNPKSTKPIPTCATFIEFDTFSIEVVPNKVDFDDFWAHLLSYYNELSKSYPLDGLVLKVKDLELRKTLGDNGKFPHWAVAWKPPMEIKETTITGIEWNVSRNGKVVPTLTYKDLELCGTINNRVTGNNAAWLRDRGISVGSKVSIGKAGEIIPKIISWDDRDYRDPDEPDVCPVCGHTLYFDALHLICDGPTCIARSIGRLKHFYSVIDIKGVGESTIETLLQDNRYAAILTKKPYALLLRDPEAHMALIKAVGPVIKDNIINAIEATQNKYNLAHLIAAYGFSELGYKNALKLLTNDPKGVNSNARNSFYTNLKAVLQDSIELKNAGYYLKTLPPRGGKLYVITGEFNLPREEIIAAMEDKGWKYRSAVSGKVNAVFVGINDNPTTKEKRATELGIPKLGKEDLMEISGLSDL